MNSSTRKVQSVYKVLIGCKYFNKREREREIEGERERERKRER